MVVIEYFRSSFVACKCSIHFVLIVNFTNMLIVLLLSAKSTETFFKIYCIFDENRCPVAETLILYAKYHVF